MAVPLVTCATVLAEVILAFADSHVAVVAFISRKAATRVAINFIMARPAILARVVGALIDVFFTVQSSETFCALA